MGYSLQVEVDVKRAVKKVRRKIHWRPVPLINLWLKRQVEAFVNSEGV